MPAPCGEPRSGRGELSLDGQRHRRRDAGINLHRNLFRSPFFVLIMRMNEKSTLLKARLFASEEAAVLNEKVRT